MLEPYLNKYLFFSKNVLNCFPWRRYKKFNMNVSFGNAYLQEPEVAVKSVFDNARSIEILNIFTIVFFYQCNESRNCGRLWNAELS